MNVGKGNGSEGKLWLALARRLVPYMHWAMESVSAQRFSETTWDVPWSMDPEKDLAWKIQVIGKLVGGGLALGFGEGDMQL